MMPLASLRAFFFFLDITCKTFCCPAIFLFVLIKCKNKYYVAKEGNEAGEAKKPIIKTLKKGNKVERLKNQNGQKLRRAII